ncbi:DNA polymerase III subunit delta' [Endozoicomonas sp. G2_1]|uniref:DNA polymerase III subunit delta' n=1 Tax=Endozoicomonas sp. G2_1 TaxID=2821091 RepID=UPI001ADBD02E|nr:DNA polymerase III subunit delta' [Endozoicomonas sp. G2_1]MBO9490782.1 DNA polymerase III subunit delta' [Endozoicomonas sp. G2_1]
MPLSSNTDYRWLGQYQSQLHQQWQQQRLPHALIFAGVSGVGKSALASWLTQLLGCQQPADGRACRQCKHCQLNVSNTYPDHKHLTPDGQVIGVDDIRQLTDFVQKRAQLGHFKTVQIDCADKMTVAASNALLKTLEEPSPNTVIVLLTNDMAKLLPTIVSRCQVISIRPPSGQALANLYNAEQQDSFVNLSQLPELIDPDVMQEYHDFCQLLVDYLQGRGSYQQLSELLVNHQHGLRWLEKYLAYSVRRSVKSTSANAQQYNNTSAELVELPSQAQQIQSAFELLLKCQGQIKHLVQVNKRYIIDKLLIELKNLLAVA